MSPQGEPHTPRSLVHPLQDPGAHPLNVPKRAKSTGAPPNNDPPQTKRDGQRDGRIERRSRIEGARCIDLLGLAFANPTLC